MRFNSAPGGYGRTTYGINEGRSKVLSGLQEENAEMSAPSNEVSLDVKQQEEIDPSTITPLQESVLSHDYTSSEHGPSFVAPNSFPQDTLEIVNRHTQENSPSMETHEESARTAVEELLRRAQEKDILSSVDRVLDKLNRTLLTSENRKDIASKLRNEADRLDPKPVEILGDVRQEAVSDPVVEMENTSSGITNANDLEKTTVPRAGLDPVSEDEILISLNPSDINLVSGVKDINEALEAKAINQDSDISNVEEVPKTSVPIEKTQVQVVADLTKKIVDSMNENITGHMKNVEINQSIAPIHFPDKNVQGVSSKQHSSEQIVEGSENITPPPSEKVKIPTIHANTDPELVLVSESVTLDDQTHRNILVPRAVETEDGSNKSTDDHQGVLTEKRLELNESKESDSVSEDDAYLKMLEFRAASERRERYKVLTNNVTQAVEGLAFVANESQPFFNKYPLYESFSNLGEFINNHDIGKLATSEENEFKEVMYACVHELNHENEMELSTMDPESLQRVMYGMEDFSTEIQKIIGSIMEDNQDQEIAALCRYLTNTLEEKKEKAFALYSRLHAD